MSAAKNEKALKAFLLTWVTHNSRVSERMLKYKVKKGEAFLMNFEMSNDVCKYLNEKIKKEKYKILAKNVLSDHIYLVLICSEDELSEITQSLKGYTSFFLGRRLGINAKKEGRQNKIWTKGSDYTYLEKEEHLLNSIEYTNNNHLKHKIPAIDSKLQSAAICKEVLLW